jgi:hypothetical protein
VGGSGARATARARAGRFRSGVASLTPLRHRLLRGRPNISGAMATFLVVSRSTTRRVKVSRTTAQ